LVKKSDSIRVSRSLLSAMSMNRVNVLLRHLQPEAMPAVPSPVAAKKAPLKVVITGAKLDRKYNLAHDMFLF
jgi:hypothetical protein